MTREPAAGDLHVDLVRARRRRYDRSTARPGEAWRGPVELGAAGHGKTRQGGGVKPTRGKPLPARAPSPSAASTATRMTHG